MDKKFIQVAEQFQDLEAVKYAQDVVSGKIIAGKYIILECIRFLTDLNTSLEDDDFEWKFDLDIYNLVVKFSEFFKFADGINAGKTMKLAKFQEWIVTNLFCWVHKEKGYVRFSRAYIQVARKQGKSFLLSYVVLIKSLLENFGQFYTVATKKDQARIVIKEIGKLLQCSIDEVKDRFTIYGKADISKIVCELTKSEIVPLSSDANTLDGLGCDLVVIDEFGAKWKFVGHLCRNTYLNVG